MHGETEEQLASEFADVMHYLLGFMHAVAPNVDLDKALSDKIASNWVAKKKVIEDNGDVVKR